MIVEIDLATPAAKSIRHTRLGLVLQNDVGNSHSPITIVAAIVGRDRVKALSEVHVAVPANDAGLTENSVILCDQISSVEQRRIDRVIGKLDSDLMQDVDAALRTSLGLD
jgi:mRNA interferase MazF